MSVSALEKLQSKISMLSASDRRALIFLSIFIIAATMYWAVMWSFTFRNRSVAAVEHNRSLMLMVYEAKRKSVANNKTRNLEGLAQPLLTLVSSTAKERHIIFKRFQPDGENVLKLWIENVSFNDLLIWLNTIDKKNGISVQEISVEQAKELGFVDVRLTLER